MSQVLFIAWLFSQIFYSFQFKMNEWKLNKSIRVIYFRLNQKASMQDFYCSIF